METLQSTLTYAIEIVVMGFVSIMVVHFVNGLFQLPHSRVIAPAATTNQALATTSTQVSTSAATLEAEPTPKFAPTQESDPWDLPVDIQPTPILPQAVVLQFPSLKLLPQAVEVQPAKTKSTKSTTKPKSTTTKKNTKPTSKAATTPRSRSGKSA